MVIFGHGKTDLSKQIMTFSTENWLKKAAMLSTYSQGVLTGLHNNSIGGNMICWDMMK